MFFFLGIVGNLNWLNFNQFQSYAIIDSNIQIVIDIILSQIVMLIL